MDITKRSFIRSGDVHLFLGRDGRFRRKQTAAEPPSQGGYIFPDLYIQIAYLCRIFHILHHFSREQRAVRAYLYTRLALSILYCGFAKQKTV